MFYKLNSAAVLGLNCLPVDIEVDINPMNYFISKNTIYHLSFKFASTIISLMIANSCRMPWNIAILTTA